MVKACIDCGLPTWKFVLCPTCRDLRIKARPIPADFRTRVAQSTPECV